MKIYRSFTLVEMLVVTSIVAILAALLLPCLKMSLDCANDVSCKTKLRQLALAYSLFATDHYGVFPGQEESEGAEEWQKKWCTFTGRGSLTSYIGGGIPNPIYRCPALAAGTWGSGTGSNGKLDYPGTLVFSGARISKIPLMGQLLLPAINQTVDAYVPIICEEDPRYYLNSTFIDVSHSGNDRLGTWHTQNHAEGNGNFACIDNSVHSLRFESGNGTNMFNWKAKAPSGNIVPVTLSGTLRYFGMWNKL